MCLNSERLVCLNSERLVCLNSERLVCLNSLTLYSLCDTMGASVEWDRLVGLVVKASVSRAEDPRFKSCWRRDFSGSSHTSDLNIGTPLATLPGAWGYRVSAGTGLPGVSVLWLGELESWICSFYLSVATCKIVCGDSSLRYTSLLLGH